MKYIRLDMEDISVRFIRLGFHLREMHNLEYYKYIPLPGGEGYYDNFYQLIFDNFGLNRSTVSRLMEINRRFCRGRMFLDDKWKNFSYSQLSEMLALKTDRELELVNCRMTVREIREVKQKIRQSHEEAPVPCRCASPERSSLCDVAQNQANFYSGWYLFRFLRYV